MDLKNIPKEKAMIKEESVLVLNNGQSKGTNNSLWLIKIIFQNSNYRIPDRER